MTDWCCMCTGWWMFLFKLWIPMKKQKLHCTFCGIETKNIKKACHFVILFMKTHFYSLIITHQSLLIFNSRYVRKKQHHNALWYSLCNELQWCPGAKICIRHELPVHWRIQGNPGKLIQMTIRVSNSVWVM